MANDIRIEQALNNKTENYILPFLWMRGEDEQTIRTEIEKIHASGIGAVCVESRPHPDYVGEGWWHDMDIVINEAKKRDMKVWILDDSSFPTGYANGLLTKKYPDRCKWFQKKWQIAVKGPLKGVSVDIKGWMSEPDDRLLCVAATKMKDNKTITDKPIIITDKVVDGVLCWDVPEGYYYVNILWLTKKGEGRLNYINMLDSSSTDVLIEACYEPHYQRYKHEFGKTIMGFFSDEPEIGNCTGYSYTHSIGRIGMSLPWSNELEQRLKNRWGEDFELNLLSIWYDMDISCKSRFDYMDIVTDLYNKNFSAKIGKWCSERGVEYIGHIIEDHNAHARLGSSTGHFFRSLAGQHMSGMDIVLHQVMPGFDEEGIFIGSLGQDGPFYHYGLGKMASSLGHIDPKKKKRTVCEIFGAYGWIEGLKLSKWLLDHALVRGATHFVPHAFSMKEDDPDAPPHFYARGKNHQYEYFHILMNYLNRMSHILQGGTHIAPAAILYHAESEWSGDYTYFQKPGSVLMQNQIDYELLPADLFANPSEYNACFEDGLKVNGESFGCLIIAGCEYIPASVIGFVHKAVEKGFTIIFSDYPPKGSCENDHNADILLQQAVPKANIIKNDDIPQFIKDAGIADVINRNYNKYLRVYHVSRDKKDIYMFFNEDPHNSIKTTVMIKTNGNPVFYDVLNNELLHCDYRITGEATEVDLELSGYQSIVLICGSDYKAEKPCPLKGKKIKITPEWQVSLANSDDVNNFEYLGKVKKLINITDPSVRPGFSGIVKYEATVNIKDDIDSCILDFGDVYDFLEVFINQKPIGVRVCPPYRFNLKNIIKKGENKIEIRVITTLAHKEKDLFSRQVYMEPTGMLGPVILTY